MHKVLVVDDEKMIRMGICRGIPWENLGVSEVYQAGNAADALDLIKEKKPDLMITDINMPEITGLELIEKVRSLLNNIKIIVLTGYERFDYAQECIRVKVEDLFLKPVDEAVLAEVIKKRLHELDDEQKARVAESTMRRVRGNAEQMRIERLMNCLLSGKVEKAELEWMCQEYSINPKQSLQFALLIPCITGVKTQKDEFLRMSVREICIDFIDGNGHGITFYVGDYLGIAFFDNGYVNEIYDRIQELMSIIKDEYNIAPRISLGSRVDGFQELYISYNEANILIQKDQKGVLDFLQSQATGKRGKLFQEIYLELKNAMCINVGNSDYVLRVFEAFCQATVSYNLTEDSIRCNCFDLASSVYFTYISNLGGGERGRLEELAKNIMCVDGHEACEVTKIFLINMFGKDMVLMHDIILKARAYIDENLKENLSVTSIAEQFYVTSNYFSKLFKKVMGEGCNEYIVKKRIEKAKSLLETTNIKTGKIASMVGYRDANYFSLAFKKYTGYSPTSYREKSRGNCN